MDKMSNTYKYEDLGDDEKERALESFESYINHEIRQRAWAKMAAAISKKMRSAYGFIVHFNPYDEDIVRPYIVNYDKDRLIKTLEAVLGHDEIIIGMVVAQLRSNPYDCYECVIQDEFYGMAELHRERLSNKFGLIRSNDDIRLYIAEVSADIEKFIRETLQKYSRAATLLYEMYRDGLSMDEHLERAMAKRNALFSENGELYYTD